MHYCMAPATYPQVPAAVCLLRGKRLSSPMAQRAVTQPRLKRSGWLPCLFGLAPCGVYRAVRIAVNAVGSYPTLSPLPSGRVHEDRCFGSDLNSRRAVCFLLHWPSLSLDAEVPDVIRHTALRSSDFPLPPNPGRSQTRRQRPSGRLHPVSVPTDAGFPHFVLPQPLLSFRSPLLCHAAKLLLLSFRKPFLLSFRSAAEESAIPPGRPAALPKANPFASLRDDKEICHGMTPRFLRDEQEICHGMTVRAAADGH